MKIQKTAVICLLVCCLLAGCGNGSAQPTTEASQETSLPTVTQEAPQEPVLYEHAVRQFFMPLEEHSWERNYDPQFVMLHFTSAVMWDRENPFNMELVRETFLYYDVSIHYVIDRDGTIYCYIPENLVAWHAGEGTWKDDEKYTNKLNQYAIGIELVAIGSQNDMSLYLTQEEYNALDPEWLGYTDAQYAALQNLVTDICSRYDIPMTREYVLGHQDYSPTKNDPGELFDWSKVIP